MGSLKVSLFGVPRLERDGETLLVSRRKTLALLAYLAVTGQSHSREVLATLIWPEDDAEFARANLRRALSELRQVLGDGSLLSDRSQVGFSPEFNFTTDVNKFKQHITHYRQHQHRTPEACDDCLSRLAEAVELYTGDFMSGFSLPDSRSFEDWQFFEAEGLRRSLAECLPVLAAGYANQGDFDRAIELTRRQVAIDSLDEPAHRELMRLYALSGQQSAALRQYQECVRLLKKELGVKPDPETTALYESIRTRQLNPRITQKGRGKETSTTSSMPEHEDAVKPTRHNLPTPASPLIGRKSELQKITAVLSGESPYRWLTITGPGGVGKTRLAMEAARNLAEMPDCCFRDGIWFVSLAPAMTSDALVEKIAQVSSYSFPEGSEQRRQKLVQFLQKKQLLLVLDNFEHLINEENVTFLGDILAAGPGMRLLVTSRAQLNARSEQVLSIVGLPTPANKLADVESTNNESIQLFRQCAVRARPDFEIQPANIQSVARICQLVQGMPLAIEMAAAWLEILSVEEIAAEIVRNLDFLEAGWQDRPDHQHSLRAVFESSWSYLTEVERQALLALAIFPSGFSRIAAEEVARVPVKTLLNLKQKSWLGQSEQGRFSIHELLRQYTQEKLTAFPDAYEEIMENYSAYYTDFLEEQCHALRSPRQKEAADSVAQEFENIQKAWEWLIDHQRVNEAFDHMLPALYHFCAARFLGKEFLQMLVQAEAVLMEGDQEYSSRPLLAIMLTARSAFNPTGFPIRFNWNDMMGAPDRKVMQQSAKLEHRYISRSHSGAQLSKLLLLSDDEAILQAWLLIETPDQLPGLSVWGILMAYLYGRLVDHVDGENSLRWLAAHYSAKEQMWERAFALSCLGTLLELFYPATKRGEDAGEEREQSIQEALQIFRHLGDHRESGYALSLLGLHYNRYEAQYDYDQAIQAWRTAQELLHQGGDRWNSLTIEVWIGASYIWMCDFENGFRSYEISIKEYLQLGHFTAASYVLSTASRDQARFGSLEQAREMREHSLELSQQLNDTFGLAWHQWEMADLCRLEGDLTAARFWLSSAKSLFDRYEDPIGRCFCERSLGDLAQIENRFDDAIQYFQKSLDHAQQADHEWAVCYALVGLGRAEISRGNFDSARDHFRKAYNLALHRPQIDMMVVSVAELAVYYAAIGENETAYALANLARSHKAAWNETKIKMDLLMQSIEVKPSQAPPLLENSDCYVRCLNELVARIIDV